MKPRKLDLALHRQKRKAGAHGLSKKAKHKRDRKAAKLDTRDIV